MVDEHRAGELEHAFVDEADHSIPGARRWQRGRQNDAANRDRPSDVGDEPGDLTRVSDEVHLIRSLDVGEPAVERILST